METRGRRKEALKRLVEVGGRMSEDVGMGRIVGQILTYLYFVGEKSAQEVGDDLGLSKGAVSTGVRQLESLGVLWRRKRPGDRKTYYRTADNISTAIEHGLMRFVSQKLAVLGAELEMASTMAEGKAPKDEEDGIFMERLARAKSLHKTMTGLVNSPFLKLLQGL